MNTELKLLISITIILLLSIRSYGQSSIKNCPCCSKNYRQFDFWLGDWNVYDTLGSKIGENLVVALQDHCVLQENWKSKNSTGTSYNYFNSLDSSWNQVWIDNSGNPLVLKGGYIGREMVLKSELRKKADGSEYYDMISWKQMPDKSVVQKWSTFDKMHHELAILFIGVYRKKE